jgi:hypothetical protein
MSEEIWPDNKVVSLQWRGQSLDLFCDVLSKYETLLAPHNTSGNASIQEEVRKIRAYREHIDVPRKNCEDPFDMRGLVMMAGEFGLIIDLLWKELSALNQEYREKKERVFVEGALEGLESRISLVKEVLELENMTHIPRKKAKVDSLYSPTPTQQSLGKQSVQYHQTIMGNVFGAAVVANYGKVEVELKADMQEAFKLLQELTELIKQMPADDRVKSDAFVDVQTIQTQLSKQSPSKTIVNAGLASLGVLADTAQISDFFSTYIAPKLDQLKPLLDHLTK